MGVENLNSTGNFAERVISWQRCHGRHGLPWQGTREPYRVWLSEIMLQQTQVATVLDYYPRFLARFPDVHTLAAAPLDAVLGLWSGLGYYSRARNLHRCARQVVSHWGGRFPQRAADLQTLPGIGPSTAAAIAAFCHGERSAILDGNVRRVLARVFALQDDFSRAAAQRDLWQRAQALLPTADLPRSMPAYTQGLMDLGALVCLPRRPDCAHCPLRDVCLARAQGRPEAFPVRRPRPPRPVQALHLLHVQSAGGQLWLAPRPERGIWARLHCLPAYASRAELAQAVPPAWHQALRLQPLIEHALTHRQLHIQVHSLCVPPGEAWQPEGRGRWFGPQDWPGLGLPAPVRRFLQQS